MKIILFWFGYYNGAFVFCYPKRFYFFNMTWAVLLTHYLARAHESTEINLKHSAVPHVTLGQNWCKPWILNLVISPGLHLFGSVSGEIAISHLTPKYGIAAVVLMGTGYINSTDTPETQLKGHLKLAQKSLSSPACRLDPESALQLDFWAGG